MSLPLDFAKPTLRYGGSLALAFSLSACAVSTPIAHEKGSCMETQSGYALGGMIGHNSTRWNESCSHAMAAVMFAKIQSRDGEPDLIGQAVAIEMYLQSNEDVQKSFRRLLEDNDMDLNEIVNKVRANNGPVCAINGDNEFVCS